MYQILKRINFGIDLLLLTLKLIRTRVSRVHEKKTFNSTEDLKNIWERFSNATKQRKAVKAIGVYIQQGKLIALTKANTFSKRIPPFGCKEFFKNFDEKFFFRKIPTTVFKNSQLQYQKMANNCKE